MLKGIWMNSCVSSRTITSETRVLMRKVFRRVLQVIFHPARAWEEIAGEAEEGRCNPVAEYLYPLVSCCALLCFAAKLVAARVADGTAPMGEVVPRAFLEIVGFFFVFIVGFYLALFFLHRLFPSSWRSLEQGMPLPVLLSYSMTLLVVLRTMGNIVEVFSFLGFPFQFYTLYIVWEGSKKMLDVPDRGRLIISVLITLVLILFTTLIANFYDRIVG